MVVDDSSVWIGTYEDGLLRYNFAEDTWRCYTVKDGLAENTVLSLAKEGDVLWTGGKNTITKFDLRNNTFEKFVIPVKLEGVSSLAVNDKYVWAAGRSLKSNSLVRLDKDTDNRVNSWTIIPNTEFKAQYDVNTIALDGKYLWIGTGDGIRRYDTETHECFSTLNESGAIPVNVVSIIVLKDSVWFGTKGKGLVCYDKIKQSWNIPLKNAIIESLVVDGKRLLVLDAINGIAKFNFDTGEYTEGVQTQILSDNCVFDILVSGKYVWIATRKGIDRCNKRNLTWDHFRKENGLPKGAVLSLVPYGNRILAGVNKCGILSFDHTFEKPVPSKFANEQGGEELLLPLLVDKNIIWFKPYTRQDEFFGLKGYNFSTGKWVFFSTESGLLNNIFHSIAADDEFVWIGTIDGVNRYEKNFPKMETFLEIKGLTNQPDNSIYAL